MRFLVSIALSFAAVNFVGCGIDLSSLEQNTDSISVFENTFSTTVPPDATNLQAYEEGVSSGNSYLRFNAPFSTVKKLTGNSFVAVNETQRTQEWLKKTSPG